MKRREFIAALGGAAALAPFAAHAQQAERVRRIGFLMIFGESDSDAQAHVRILLQQLGELGHVVGRNLQVDYRWGAAEPERARTLAQELVGMQLDAIIACGGPAAIAMWNVTRSVPIVFVQVVDPVGLRIVGSLARPGGNLTGFTHFESAIVGKWLEALKEIAPGMNRTMVLFDVNNQASDVYLRGVDAVPASFGVQLISTGVRDAAEIERAVARHAGGANTGLIVLPAPLAAAQRELIIALAARHRLPAIYPHRFFTKDGGLLSYGADLPAMYRRAAGYVDRVLRGVKPADLPVQAPTKYELVINLNTAKALGLTVPPMLLARADEVIE